MTNLEKTLDELEQLIADRYLSCDSVTLKDFCYQMDVLDLLRKTLK